ncbi:MAG: AEC family transporter [Coriobacteriia bacterium]|nr:AEC family transporter [Coriobacteriia bacterium]
MGVETALSQMIVLFFGIIVGFVAYRMGILDDKGCKSVTGLVMNITLPCFIVLSGLTSTHATSGPDMLKYFGVSVTCYCIAAILGLLASRLPFFERKDMRLCAFMTTFGNTGFIGLPFIGGMFGADAVLYATVFNLPFNLLVFSIGVYLVSDGSSDVKINPRMFVNPNFVASLIAIAFYLLGVTLPELPTSCLSTIGSATVPLSMIITGATLGKETPKDVFTNPGLYLLSAIKIVAVPLISFALLTALIPDPTMVRIGTLLMAMPIAANATMLCIQYGGNDRMASRGVFLSTLFSVATIPLFVAFIG